MILIFTINYQKFSANAPTQRELMEYQETIDRANELLRTQRDKESLCDVLIQFEHHPNNFKHIARTDFRFTIFFASIFSFNILSRKLSDSEISAFF